MITALSLALVLSTCGPPALPDGSLPACEPVAVGLDTSCANTSAPLFLGGAIGETFLARDTLISSVTVWRVAAQDTNGIGIHLFILETDSTGAPNPSAVLLNGPTVRVLYGDGIHPIRFDFMFDPPFALPRPGTYGIVVQGNPCYGTVNLIADDRDDYSDGSVWFFGRSDCYLRSFPKNYPGADLIFTIVFCSTATPARPSTWGEIKARYR
jgi:hypothetical protein